MSLVQNGAKRVVGRAGVVKEVRCPDLSHCRRSKQGSPSGTVCEQAHCCPGMRVVTCSSSHCSDAPLQLSCPSFPPSPGVLVVTTSLKHMEIYDGGHHGIKVISLLGRLS